MLSSVAGAVIASDHEGYIMYLNREAERITGVSASSAVKSSLDHVLRLDCDLSKDIAKDGLQAEPNKLRTTLVTKAGGQVEIELAHRRLLSQSNEPHGDLFTFWETTEP